MEFLSMRELRSSTGAIREMLSGDGKIVVTNNGKPEAIMIGVNGDSFEETLMDLRQIRAKRAFRELQRQAKINGLDKLSFADIDEEIAATRRERKTKEA